MTSVLSATGPNTEVGLTRLRAMLRIRRFEERCVELYSATRIRGFLHLYIGEEAVAVGVNEALAPTDAVVSTYREHGHALARGVPMDAVMAEMFGKVTGCSRGRGGSMHLFHRPTRFYGGNAIVAGGLPLALGLALADKLRPGDAAAGDAVRAGGPVTTCFFGDGAFAEGEFHETANLAALWRLPLLLCCENNRYAMGTAIARANAEVDLALRAAGYGMPAWSVDGMDVTAVAEAARHATEMIRAGGGPVFLQLDTYRFRAHSMYDPERYRDRAEVDQWRARDPIEAMTAELRETGSLDESALAGLEAEITEEIDAAVATAEAAAVEDVADLTRFVYSEVGQTDAGPVGTAKSTAEAGETGGAR